MGPYMFSHRLGRSDRGVPYPFGPGLDEAGSCFIGSRLPLIVGVKVTLSGPILDIIAEKVDDKQAIYAGTV